MSRILAVAALAAGATTGMYVADLRRELAVAKQAAVTDPLTGLANRAGLRREFEQLVVATTPPRRIGVLLLDLDGFKPINDQYGHDAGDRVLQQVAHRLNRVRAGGGHRCVARLGGDEFVVVAEFGRGDNPIGHAAKLADACRKPIVLGEVQVEVGVSIGIAEADADLAGLPDLLAAADAAMYRAKRLGDDLGVYDAVADGPPDRAPRPPIRTRDSAARPGWPLREGSGR